MDKFSIRRVQLEDWPYLEKLYLHARIDAFKWVDPAHFKLSDFSQDTSEEEMWVALHKERIVGFISVWAQNSFIHHLYVDKKYHNKGIGSALLNEVAKHFPSPLRLKCLSQNEKAVKFYEKKGWIHSGITKRSDIYGDYITYIYNPGPGEALRN